MQHAASVDELMFLRKPQLGDFFISNCFPWLLRTTPGHELPSSWNFLSWVRLKSHWASLSGTDTSGLEKEAQGCLSAQWTWGGHSLPRVVPEAGTSATAAAKWLQSRPTLCDPIDGSPPGSSVHRILWARILEWVAISFSKLAQNHGQNPVSWIPSRTPGLVIPLYIYSLSVLSTGNTSFDPEKASPHGACILGVEGLHFKVSQSVVGPWTSSSGSWMEIQNLSHLDLLNQSLCFNKKPCWFIHDQKALLKFLHDLGKPFPSVHPPTLQICTHSLTFKGGFLLPGDISSSFFFKNAFCCCCS